MDQLTQQITAGLSTGLLYGLLGLAIVLVFRASKILNFGQGALATLSAYAAWLLLQYLSYALGVVLALGLSFGLGAFTYRALIRPFETRPPMQTFVVLVMIFQIGVSLSLGFFGPDPKSWTVPIDRSPIRVAGAVVSTYDLYTFAVALAGVLLLYVLFQLTRLGLALRATAEDPDVASLMGVSTRRMLTLSWGLAGVGGAVAGILAAPILGLTPELMFSVLIGALAGVILGGLDSALGAVIGGLVVAVFQNIVATYVDSWVGFINDSWTITDPAAYRNVATVILLLAVLLVRPAGMFGKRAVVKA